MNRSNRRKVLECPDPGRDDTALASAGTPGSLESVLLNAVSRFACHRTPGRKRGINGSRLLQIALFLLVGCVSARADIPPDWSTNYDATLALARTNQMPSLVYFTASWCGPCKLMTRLTLVNAALTDELTNVAHVAVDIDAHSDLAAQRGINAVPTFVVLSATGDEVDRTTGFQPIGDFLPWLTNGLSKAKEAMARQALSRQTLAEVDQMLASTEADAAHDAASKLFDLCNTREDAMVQAAGARLKVLAKRDPAAVLDGLNDPRLAPRIQAANALRDTIGDAFDIDPWSDTATRRKAVESWREKLSAGQKGT